MQRRDIRAVGDLAGEASSLVTTLVRGMHAGIAGRVFDSIGPPAASTRVIHDGLTRAIYGGVDWGIRGATQAVGDHRCGHLPRRSKDVSALPRSAVLRS